MDPKATALLREEIAKKISEIDDKVLHKFAYALNRAIAGSQSIYAFGNGGSAALASHLCTELLHIVQANVRVRCGAIVSLSADGILLSAFANDYGFDQVFALQLKAMLKSGDVVIGISASGKSVNVLQGLTVAKEYGALTLGLTGKFSEALAKLCTHCLSVNSENIYVTETVHVCFVHLLSLLIRYGVA